MAVPVIELWLFPGLIRSFLTKYFWQFLGAICVCPLERYLGVPVSNLDK